MVIPEIIYKLSLVIRYGSRGGGGSGGVGVGGGGLVSVGGGGVVSRIAVDSTILINHARGCAAISSLLTFCTSIFSTHQKFAAWLLADTTMCAALAIVASATLYGMYESTWAMYAR